MESVFKMNEVINLFYNKKGEIVKLPFETNAIIVHLFPDVDYNGNQIFKRVVTIACCDDDMLGPLKKEAYDILERKV